jgi:UDP-N-acetylglucosamine 2-epimerase (non-hydrolysing)
VENQRQNELIVKKMTNQQIQLANSMKRPLYMLFIATKPCYIKLASVVHALKQKGIPHLVVDTGQHYDESLVSARFEFDYYQEISVFLGVNGDLLKRNELLHPRLREMNRFLVRQGLIEQAIPLVSGDTSSAGMIPLIWYFLTGIKSIHIEGGLRSFTPAFHWSDDSCKDFKRQLSADWNIEPDAPFPEGVDTRLASLCAQYYFAPVNWNKKNLLNEGYASSRVVLSGSLSADAVNLIRENHTAESIFSEFPELLKKIWVRVDIHRRENMNRQRLTTLLEGLKIFQKYGGNVLFVMTNSLKAGIKEFQLEELLKNMEGDSFLVTEHWRSYSQVIEFIESDYCAGIYTDSGGLQEESNVLGIKCVTFRYNTDRPESITEGRTNVLLPPVSAAYIAKGLKAVFIDQELKIGGEHAQKLYGNRVGEEIAEELKKYRPVKPVVEHIITY